ncbi:MAG: hypothetical protein D6B27_11730 [Gammaproteobacteria bacterium]|nr:MAG: hypothetical protein D6B27_11730 [Gammaproteobacteria bacterium]
MPTMAQRMKLLAQDFFSKNDMGSEQETRISLFMQAIKTTNAAILAKIEFQPFEWEPYKSFHRQYYKEIELSTLLNKATSWSTNPFVYMEATQLNLSLWQKADINQYLQGFFAIDEKFFTYLALSHALMAEVRFLPVLPPTLSLDTPFLSAIREIEEENGRQIQAQIRLLKAIDVSLTEEHKQDIVAKQQAIVQSVFCELLAAVCKLPEEEVEELARGGAKAKGD